MVMRTIAEKARSKRSSRRSYTPTPTVIAAELELARFFASQPSTETIVAFHPSPEIADHYYRLLGLERGSQVSAEECAELDTYMSVERLMRMIKAEALHRLAQQASRVG
jgi:hypothetical protein